MAVIAFAQAPSLHLAMAVMRRFPRLWLISRDAYIGGEANSQGIAVTFARVKKHPLPIIDYSVHTVPGKHVSRS